MGKNKKPFIQKKNASTYHLMHRSQRDVAGDVLMMEEGDTSKAGMVLWPSPDNNVETDAKVLVGQHGSSSATMSAWRDKLAQAGLIDVDHERYLKSMSGGTFLDTNGRVVSTSTATATTAPSQHQEEALLMEVNRQLDSIPLTSECMDPDVAAALFDDFEEGDFEELNDDFVLDAARDPSPSPDNDDKAQDGGFDFDQHIQRLMEQAKKEREDKPVHNRPGHVWGKNDSDFFANQKPLEERNSDDDEKDSLAEYGTVTTTPGVVPALAPEEERALCEKFEETLAEYDSDELGECPEEEAVEGLRPLEGDAQVEAALNDFLQERDDEVFMQGTRHYLSKAGGGSGFSALVGKQMKNAKELANPCATEEDEEVEPPEPIAETLAKAQEALAQPPVQPPAEEILIDGQSYFSERVRNPWDCESILSTYSNLDNNPTTINASRRHQRKKKKPKSQSVAEEPVQPIRLSNKTGLPIGVLPTRVSQYDDFADDTIVSVNRGEARKKNETPEEKRARKEAIKRERQMARIQKKVTREVYKEEFQRRAVDVMADDVAGKSVFRYS